MSACLVNAAFLGTRLVFRREVRDIGKGFNRLDEGRTWTQVVE